MNKESGIWLGDYSECISVDEPGFEPKYCLLSTATFHYGICLPKVCTKNDIKSVIDLGCFLSNFLIIT